MKLQEDDKQQREILEFWFGCEPHTPSSIDTKRKNWYAGSSNFDEEIRSRFEEVFENACYEVILHWAESAQGSIALTILLDQFSRNLHRNTARAYQQDALARAVAKRTIKHGFDIEMSVPERIFLFHPFHHSESLADQIEGCRLLDELNAEGHKQWESLIQTSISWFESHRETVGRFGRFPHRNEYLDRKSTDEELLFLNKLEE